MTIISNRPAQTVMPRHESLRWLTGGAVALDATVVAVTILVATFARGRLDLFTGPTDVTENVGIAGPMIALAWIGLVALMGGYYTDLYGSDTEEYKRVLRAGLLTAGLAGVGCYLAKFPLSRGFFVLAFGIGIPALLIGRFVLRRVIHSARRRGLLMQRAILVGSAAHVNEVAHVLRHQPTMGYEVLGALTPASDLDEETSTGVPVLGNAEDVVAIAHDTAADTIMFTGGGLMSAHHLRKHVWELEHDAFKVVVAPGVSEISSERISVRPLGGLPLMHIEKPTWVNASRFSKRAFDLVGAFLILVLVGPVMLTCAALIKIHDRGPVLFRQTRVARDGISFDCFKFRSMVVDAEAKLIALHQQMAFEGGLFKMVDDPRITGPGRWLRRFSLDELPQLLNVVRGDMSLVGPRPPLPSEALDYAEQTARRLRVRPGMTGLWQVSGRSDLSFEEAVRLDLYYVDNWSMLQDLSILCRTVGAVFSSRGAY